MTNTRKAPLPLLIAALALLLSGCLPSDSDPDKVSKASESPQALMAATSLMNVNLSITRAVVNSDDWKAGRLIEGPIAGSVVSTAVGTSQMGSYAAALCVIDSKPHVLTWIDSKDASGTFKPQNASVSTGAILGSVAKKMSGGEVGQKGANGIALANSTTKALAGGCAGLAIPADAPVILSKLANDTNIGTGNLAVFSQEIRQTPCENGKQGVIVQSRAVNRTDKNAAPSNWTTLSNSCTEISEVTTIAADKNAINMATNLIDTQGAIADELKVQLANMSCTNASLQPVTKTDKYGRETDSRSNKKTTQITTCTSASIVPIIKATPEDTQKTSHEDVRIIPCAGPQGALSAKIGVFDTTGETSKWTGSASFKRNTNYEKTGETEAIAHKQLWIPDQLDCRREDTTNLPCANATPPETDITPFSSNETLVYKRKVKISSYADKKKLLPSSPDLNSDYSRWTQVSGSCQWLKKEITNTSCANGMVPVPGEREYTIVADALTPSGYLQKDMKVIKEPKCDVPPISCSAPFRPANNDVAVWNFAKNRWRIGTVGDNYWGGRCATYDRLVYFDVGSAEAIDELRITGVGVDDHIMIQVNGQIAFTGPVFNRQFMRVINGSQVAYGGIVNACERSTSWNWGVNVDLKPYLQDGRNEIFIRTVVSGGGEMWFDLNVSSRDCEISAENMKAALYSGRDDANRDLVSVNARYQAARTQFIGYTSINPSGSDTEIFTGTQLGCNEGVTATTNLINGCPARTIGYISRNGTGTPLYEIMPMDPAKRPKVRKTIKDPVTGNDVVMMVDKAPCPAGALTTNQNYDGCPTKYVGNLFK